MRRVLVWPALIALLLAGCLDPTTGRPPSSTATVPAYTSSITTVTAAQLGTSWRTGCPVAPADLRRVQVAYWGYDGKRATGTVIVHRLEATDIAAAFGKLYASRFQIKQIRPVTDFGSSDDRSMAANNTSAFNCRAVTGGTGWSEHSYGRAIDINPIQNPYVRGSTILPSAGSPYADRSHRVPGMIHAGDAVVRAFAAIGWSWGGAWSSLKDYQHFSSTGR